jgi:hypothetical protein
LRERQDHEKKTHGPFFQLHVIVIERDVAVENAAPERRKVTLDCVPGHAAVPDVANANVND